MVKKVIEPTSSITILGFTDNIGDAAFNKELARKRCESVQGALGTSIRDLPVTLEAIGNDRLLFDNALPEGRTLCRTVQIIVETKIAGEKR